jgi:hypothetical protein
MRDDPWDTPIPEKFEPSLDYHGPRLEEAKKLLAEVESMSLSEADKRAYEEHAFRLAAHEKYAKEFREENDRYRSMLNEVLAWECKAEGIKAFMADQLRISISDYSPQPPIELSGDEWLREMRLKALHDIAYHEKAIAEEIHRTEMRNQWLASLRRSLPSDSSALRGHSTPAE